MERRAVRIGSPDQSAVRRRAWTAWRRSGIAAALLLALVPAAAAVSFEEVAPEEGIPFHRAGDRSNDDPSFVETMGGGACWLDHDRDGDQDLFLVDGWYNDTALAASRPRSVLYRNDGPRAGPDFVDATDAAGLDVRGWTQGCSAADYDADGWDDLFVMGYGIQSLFRNRGDGTFANVSEAAGISPLGKCPPSPCWGSGSAWADYDRDGCLDLYVINFVDYDIEAGGPRSPGRYNGQSAQLYRNACDGTFDDVTMDAGVTGDPGPDHGKNWGVTWLDYDLDGWLDIYVASDGVPNILYRNEGVGTFTDTSAEAGVDDPRNGMGLTAGDCDEDGDEELFFTHYSSVPELPWYGWDGFFVNEGNATFTDHSGEGDLIVTEPYVKWGVGWQDFDNDADVDIHVAAGGTENVWFDAEQPHLLWMGDGACHWTDARASGGAAMATAFNSRGSAYADWDLDGDVDIVVVNIMDQPGELLRNQGTANHWLTLELREPGGNPRGIGARINVTLPSGETLHRRMMPYSSVHSSGPAQVHVGLGAATSANVTVVWPREQVEERFNDLEADQVLRLHRGGRVQRDTLAPVPRLAVDGPAGAPDWWLAPVTVAVEAEDRGVAFTSGVAHTYLSVDGGAELEDAAPVALGEGLHRLRFRAADHDGNERAAEERLVGVDATLPVSEGTLDGTLVAGWYRGPVRVELACQDAVSGPDRLEWRLDAGAWVRYDGPFDLTRPGAHTFAWRCVDAAGHEEAPHEVALALDLGHPETIASLAGPMGLEGWWRGAVQVTLDAAGGLRQVTLTKVAVDGAAAQDYAGPVTVEGDGEHVVRFWSEDDAGRVEPAREVPFRTDATPPRAWFTDLQRFVDQPWGLVVGSRHGVVARAEDDGSGLASLASRSVDMPRFRPPQLPIRFDGEGRYDVELQGADRAGNEVLSGRAVYVDATPPTVAVLRPANSVLAVGDAMTVPLPPGLLGTRAILVGAVTLEAAAADSLAGVDLVAFRVDGAVVAAATAPPWTWTWDLPPGRTSRAVAFVATDRVGNGAAVSFRVEATGDPEAVLRAAGLEPPELPAAPAGGEAEAAMPVLLAGVAIAAAGARGRRRGR